MPDLTGLDHVTCTCELTVGTGVDDSLDDKITVNSDPVVFDPVASAFVFTLTPKPKLGALRDFFLQGISL